MKKDISTEIITADQISNSLAIPDEVDPLFELQGQTVIHEQGIVALSTNKGATSFNSGTFGTGTVDGPLKCVILDVDIRRTLWPFGLPEVVDKINEWSGKRPVCSSKNTWHENGTVTPGAIKGVISKDMDDDADEMVKNLIVPILESRCRCRPKGFRGSNGFCQWSEYGTAFSGAGQACRESRLLLLYLIDENLVCTLNVNPTSLNNWGDYDITFQNKHWSTIVTQIDSDVVKKDANQYNVLRFTPYKENKVVIKTTKDMLAPIFVEAVHNGQPMRMSKAYIQQFRDIGFEVPEYNEETGEVEF